MKIRAWGPLVALLSLLSAAVAGVYVQYSSHRNLSKNQIGGVRSYAYPPPIHAEIDLKLTDWLLVLFNGLLALYTWRLYLATRGLREAAENQSIDIKNSTKAAADAAQAAISANQIALMNNESQLRAYVTVQEIEVKLHRQPATMGGFGVVVEGAVHTYRLAVVLKNGGMTPAVNATINMSHRRFDGPMPADFDFPDSNNSANALLGPQVPSHTPTITIPAAEIEAQAGGVHYLWGWIEYDDIFRDTFRHRTEFCFRIDQERLPTSNELWIGFVPHSRFNAADENCVRPFDPHNNRYQ